MEVNWAEFTQAVAHAPFGYQFEVPLGAPWDRTIKDSALRRDARVRLFAFEYLKIPSRDQPLDEFMVFERPNNIFALVRKSLPQRDADSKHDRLILDWLLGGYRYSSGRAIPFDQLTLLTCSASENFTEFSIEKPYPKFGYQVYIPRGLRINTHGAAAHVQQQQLAIARYVSAHVLPGKGETGRFDVVVDPEQKCYAIAWRRAWGAIILDKTEQQGRSESYVFFNRQSNQTLRLKGWALPKTAGEEFLLIDARVKTREYGFRFSVPQEVGHIANVSNFIRDEILGHNGEDTRGELYRRLQDARTNLQVWIRERTTSGARLVHVDTDDSMALFRPAAGGREILVPFASMEFIESQTSARYGYRLWVPMQFETDDLALCNYVQRALGHVRATGVADVGMEADYRIVRIAGRTAQNGKYYAVVRRCDSQDSNNIRTMIVNNGGNRNFIVFTHQTNQQQKTQVKFDQLLDITRP